MSRETTCTDCCSSIETIVKERDTNTLDPLPYWKIISFALGAVLFVPGLLPGWPFGVSWYITLPIYGFAYLLLGGKVIQKAARNIIQGRVFDENFLMTVATVGAFAIGKYPEAVAVMLFYQVGEFFQELAVGKSKQRIAELMDIRPDFANLERKGNLTQISSETVEIGDVILVKPGEKIPLDGIVIEGNAQLDTSALTGESVPRRASVSDTVLSGCINQNGVLRIRVTKAFGESTVSKIIDLIENAAQKKAPTETFITKFARYYTPVVVGVAVLLAVIPPLFFGGVWADWISRSLIFLVISCPCALVVSIPLGFFGGIGGASKKGILVKGGQYLEALANLDLVVFDKTGTLTKGVFKVTQVLPADGHSERDLLELAASAEVFSNHPIALSIGDAYGREIAKSEVSQYEEIAGLGVRAVRSGKTIHAGNEKLMAQLDIALPSVEGFGTRVYVAADGVFAGCLVLSDEIKPDSEDAIAALKQLGVRKTVMLSGDHPEIATAVASKLKLDEVYSSLLPWQKVEQVELLMGQKRPKTALAFVGDGLNDAPALAMADVGVAMGGLGSDAAIEAADVVLMTDEPSKLMEAIETARFTKRIVWQNIGLALGVKALFLVLGALGISSLWEAVFADVGVTLLAVFNAMRVMHR